MKKLLCFLLCLTLIFSSVSLSFAATADWTTTDQSNLSNASSKLTAIYNTLSSGGTIYNTLNTISNNLVDIKNYLFDDGHDVAYWTSAIASWMSPIFNAITNIPVDMNSIIGALGYTKDGTYYPYLLSLSKGLTNYGYIDPNESARFTAHQTLFTSGYNYQEIGIQDGGRTFNSTWSWTNGSPLGNIALILTRNNSVLANSYAYRWAADLTGYNSSQTALNWTDLDSQYNFTPLSATDGIYKWLATLQAPVARLSYVLASDERIEAQEAAAANEEAVVDNFIDSSGDGAASPSDIGSVSDLSSGYKQNFGTDASPSGIFDIFNSDHATWFSQETKNQLDTTTPTRLSKGAEYETPLLDKQIEDIYNALGVKKP